MGVAWRVSYLKLWMSRRNWRSGAIKPISALVIIILLMGRGGREADGALGITSSN